MLALSVPAVVTTISAALGWSSRCKPASAKTALLLLLIPITAAIFQITMADTKEMTPTILGIFVLWVFSASVPWCFFYAYRARKTGEKGITTAAVMAIASFLMLACALQSYGLAAWVVQELLTSSK